jgi:hypothetical protein
MYLNGVWSAPVPQFGLLVTGTGKHFSALVGINLTWSLGQLTPHCNNPLLTLQSSVDFKKPLCSVTLRG